MKATYFQNILKPIKSTKRQQFQDKQTQTFGTHSLYVAMVCIVLEPPASELDF